MINEGKEFFSPGNKDLSKLIEEMKASPLPEVLAYFKQAKQEIESANKFAQDKAHLYKHMMKQVFGICDGEQLDTLSLIEVFALVKEKMK